MVLLQNSGAGGAALWRRKFGETLHYVTRFPSWLCENAKKFTGREEDLPVDQPVIESTIGYHLRSGFHGLELYDWEQYMKFIEYHFMKIPIRSVHEIYYPNGELLDHYPNKVLQDIAN